MKLSIPERLVLLQALPPEGDIVTMKVIKDLRNNLYFSEKEIEDYSITVNEEAVNWDETKAEEKDVEIGNKAFAIITKTLEELNDDKKLTINHLSVYEKFLGTGE